MRKGFMLTELLVVLAVLSFVSVALAGLFRTLISDIPRASRVVQANTSLLNMLGQMREDIDAAKQLPRVFAEYTTDNKMLLIELSDGIICYQLKEDQVLRRRLKNAQEDGGEDMEVWSVPHAKIQWQVWKKDGKGYAVEVKTHIEYNVRGHLEKKMANSHLYFVGPVRKLRSERPGRQASSSNRVGALREDLK